MIKNSINKLYIGITKNPRERVNYHNLKQGAKFTKNVPHFLGTGKPNYKIVFLEEHSTLAEARKREIQIKKWRREKKEILIERFKEKLPTKL